VPELTQAARDLYAIGEKIHKDLQRRFMLPVWIALAVGAVLVLAGWLYVNNRIEANSRGLRVTVATQQKIIDDQVRPRHRRVQPPGLRDQMPGS
jgi:type VI protein secretion system component VasF